MWQTFARTTRLVIGALLIVGTATHAQQLATTAQQINGTGEWQSLTGDAMKGTWTATLSRGGGHVQGNLDLTGSNVFSGGSVTGDVNGSNILLGMMVDGVNQATFSGILRPAGTVSGEWQSDAVSDSGVWSGTLRTGQAVQ